MKIILAAVFGSLLLVGLNSCVSNPEETQASFDRESDMDLCVGYMYYDWMNIYQQYRARAIQKRNIDCRPYVEIAARKYNMDRAAWNSLYEAVDSLNTSGATTQSSSNNQKGFLQGETKDRFIKICYYRGVRGTYTLNIKVTELCPLMY